MITLSNIGKVYATRRKRKIYGLKEVNLTFPDKGLCLILGKSGSGKTTLLNILGGLDAKYEGEYEFMGKKLQQKDFPELRQNHISFVFQDFNLIDDYTVADNVALGIQLSQNSSAVDVETALCQVGLSGYGERYPKELSGGQQQRVAIARALLKKSSFLLADEPTGNLDNDNSVEIYNLLKEISKDKLVIVVSHNEELGLQYADYVVRLNKGRVVSENLPDVCNGKQYTASKTHVIGAKQAFKMGARELTRQKVKSAFTIVIMAVCFCVLSFTILAVPLFRMSDVHYSLVKHKGYEYVMLTDVTYDEFVKLQNNGVDMIVGDSQSALMDKRQMEELGFEFYDGALPLGPNSYYVSDYALLKLVMPDRMGYVRNEAIIDGEETRFSEANIPYLAGQRILHYGRNNICAGIFKSDLTLFDDEFARYYKPFDNITIGAVVTERSSDGISVATATYDGKQVDISGEFTFGSVANSYGKRAVLTVDGLTNIDQDCNFESKLAGNEVFVGLETFNRIFQTQYTVASLLEAQQDSFVAKRIPAELGKTVTITMANGVTATDLTVKGISFVNYSTESISNDIIFSNDRYDYRNSMLLATRPFNVWVATQSVKDLKGLLATHNHFFSYYSDIYSPVSQYTSEIAKSFDTVRLSLLGISVGLIVVTILMTNLLISGQITGQKRKIGIYKALGASDSDIQKIYLFEMLLIVLPMILLTIASTAIVTAVLNAVYVKNIHPDLTVIYYSWVNIPITILAIGLVVLIGVITPLRKITKLNVIEAIKDTSQK